MEFKNCKRCKAVFTGGGDLCFKCKEEENDNFVKVRDYIICNPHSDLKTVAKETSVDEKFIFSLLREKRIKVSEGLAGSLKCEKCHKPISAGRLCVDCQKQFLSVIKKQPVAKAPEENVESDVVHKTDSHIKNYEYMTSAKARK